MSDRKIIAVVGATGAQGGSLASAILDDVDGGFAVRALTRKPDSEEARALAERGAEVVQADLDDIDSLVRAFEGAWGAFCVTNFWESMSPEKEQQQARNMADAAKKTGLKHVIWSTLDDTRQMVPLEDDRMPTLMGRYKVPHFDSKGEMDTYFLESGVPTTCLQTVFYWDNLIHFGMGPKRGEDGVLRLILPIGEEKLPGIAASDIGGCAYGIFKRGPELAGLTIGIAGDHPTGEQMAAALSNALGEKVEYAPVTPEVYRSFGFPGAEDLGNMFQFKADFNDRYTITRPVGRSRDLYPQLQSFSDWAQSNADRISTN
jgi:uncharacterized protein YbjT (DUF2867 family)